MDNRYRPPSADVARGDESRPSLGWFAYALVLVLLYAALLAMEGVAWMRLADAVDVGIMLVGVTGLIGFALRRGIWRRSLWRVWAVLQPAWDLAILFLLEPAGLMGQIPGSEPLGIVDAAIGLGVMAPLWFGLFRYAHRMPELWNEAGGRS